MLNTADGSNLDVLFIYPPTELGKKPKFSYPPLGILYLASFLKEKGFKVKVIDFEVKGHSLSQIMDIVSGEKPLLTCISIMTPQAVSCLEIAEAVKKKIKTFIAVGGPHISSTREEILRFTDAIDFAVYQEGEHTLHELLKCLKGKDELKDGLGDDLNKVKGLIYKRDREIIRNLPRERIADLDELPFPDLGMIDIGDYDSYYAKTLPLTSMVCSRGCPYQCSFCDQYATHGRVLRLRSPENVVDEIEKNYHGYGIKQIVFKDSTFTVNKDWIKKLCEEIGRRKLKINWVCNTRVDHIDDELLGQISSAGCYMIQLCIESGSQKILDNINKNIRIPQIVDAVKLCKKHDIKVCGYFMIGNPGETKETAEESIRFAKSLGLDYVLFCVTVAYPNTELYNWAVKNNVLSDKLWYMKKIPNKARGVRTLIGNLNLSGFPVEEQIRMVKKADRLFYLRFGYILKRIMSISSPGELKRIIKSAKEVFFGS
ncbi:hypothetical protein CMO89_04290 [Candidatus Woesearchaeota archaeon]|nr:hypothetical protein [Candidatus Woesearchaeota archaeon]|tara:strand:- start:308 stop:1762 length:1455 start_codon:yes stop_codon:yes gene_type:complete